MHVVMKELLNFVFNFLTSATFDFYLLLVCAGSSHWRQLASMCLFPVKQNPIMAATKQNSK